MIAELLSGYGNTRVGWRPRSLSNP